MKSFATNKITSPDAVISLNVSDSIENDPFVVCNEYFSKVAEGIENDQSIDDDDSTDCFVK